MPQDKYKILIVVVLIPFILLSSGYFIFTKLSHGYFNTNQDLSSERIVKSARSLISNEISTIAKISQDWGEWTELYESTKKKDGKFVADALGVSQMTNLNIDMAVIIADDDDVVFETSRGVYGVEKNNIPSGLLKKIVLLSEDEKIESGIFQIEGQKPVIFAFSPILKSDASGPSVGRLFFGKNIDSALLNKISEVVLFPVSILSENDLLESGQYAAAIDALKSSDLYLENNNGRIIEAYMNLATVDGSNIIIKANSPANILIAEKDILNILIVILGIAALLSGTLTYAITSLFLNRKINILLEEVRKPIPNFEYLQKNAGDRISELLTEIKNALKRTKESTDFGKYLTAVSNSTNDAIITTDTNGTIESWNRSAERIFGYSADFAIGKSILLIVMPERKDVAISIIKDRILKGEGIFNYAAKLRTASEKTVDVTISATAIKDDSGNFVAITNVIKDSTKEKECELVLQNKIDELEKINQLMIGRELKITELKKKLEKYEP